MDREPSRTCKDSKEEEKIIMYPKQVSPARVSGEASIAIKGVADSEVCHESRRC